MNSYLEQTQGKCCSHVVTVLTIFTRRDAVALIKFFGPQVRCLFEGGAIFEGGTYLKFGQHKESFLTVIEKSIF